MVIELLTQLKMVKMVTSTNWCILVAKLNFPSQHERLFAIILLDIYPNTKKMALVQKVSAKAR